MGGYRECDHKAPVAGVMTVFACVEYPADEPPASITIDGLRYVRRGMTDGQASRARELWADGVRAHDVAKQVGVSYNTLMAYVRGHRDDFARRGPRPLTTAQVSRIRELRGQGASVKSIAHEVGCCEDSVRRLLRP